MKRSGKVMKIAAVVLVCTLLMGMPVHAELFPKTDDYLTLYNLSGTVADAITSPRNVHTIYAGYSLKYDSQVTVTSSSGAVKIKKLETKVSGVPVIGFQMWADKKGTATIKATFTDSSGLKKTSTQKIHTYKWSNPFKTLKIGKKSFKKAFKKTNEKKITPVKGKLSIKMNSKFKILKVYYVPKGGARKAIKKNAKVDLKSGDMLILKFNDHKNRVKNVEAAIVVK